MNTCRYIGIKMHTKYAHTHTYILREKEGGKERWIESE